MGSMIRKEGRKEGRSVECHSYQSNKASSVLPSLITRISYSKLFLSPEVWQFDE